MTTTSIKNIWMVGDNQAIKKTLEMLNGAKIIDTRRNWAKGIYTSRQSVGKRGTEGQLTKLVGERRWRGEIARLQLASPTCYIGSV